MKTIFTTACLLTFVFFSCKKDKAEDPEEETPVIESVKFTAEVQPIFQQSCGTGGSCHGSSNGADGKIYETHAGASSVPDSQTLGSIKHSPGFKNMPQGGAQLSATKIAIIEAWINGGKLND
ncbi:MAG: hypothetical protein ABF264_05665 [Flavobacteriales bacterium]|jgi:hypothetical protein